MENVPALFLSTAQKGASDPLLIHFLATEEECSQFPRSMSCRCCHLLTGDTAATGYPNKGLAKSDTVADGLYDLQPKPNALGWSLSRCWACWQMQSSTWSHCCRKGAADLVAKSLLHGCGGHFPGGSTVCFPPRQSSMAWWIQRNHAVVGRSLEWMLLHHLRFLTRHQKRMPRRPTMTRGLVNRQRFSCRHGDDDVAVSPVQHKQSIENPIQFKQDERANCTSHGPQSDEPRNCCLCALERSYIL